MFLKIKIAESMFCDWILIGVECSQGFVEPPVDYSGFACKAINFSARTSPSIFYLSAVEDEATLMLQESVLTAS